MQHFSLYLIVGLFLVLAARTACTGDVVREIVTTLAPGPTETALPSQAQPQEQELDGDSVAAQVYKIGIAEDLTTTKYWAYVGPDRTVWNQYVLA